MTTRSDRTEPGTWLGSTDAWAAFLRSELAVRPGRFSAALRMAVLSALVVLIFETFHTPLPAYSAYIVLFLSKDEIASTVQTAVAAALAATVAILVTLLIYMISAGEPGLRLPLLAVVAFVGLFFSRVSPLGPVALVIGFVASVALTLIDVIPNIEALTELVLWLWLVVAVPAGVVIIGNLLTGRDSADLFRESLATRLDEVGRLLVGEQVDPKILGEHIRAGLTDPLRYLKMSGRKWSRRQTEAYEALIARSHELMVLAAEWTRLDVDAASFKDFAGRCGEAVQTIAQSVATGSPAALARPLPAMDDRLWDVDPRAALLLSRMADIVSRLPDLLAEKLPVDEGEPAKSPAKHGLLVADAFTNPDHLRFALKVTLAVICAYVAYNLLAWPGIRTAMITCFFVTVGNVGETAHKMALRLAGAVIGGALGYATLIFLMPVMDSIGHLCLAIAAVAFLAAWIAVGSEKLSYAGMQIAMAYFFCVLVGYGPTIDLTEAKNRVIGIILGNVIVWVVFSLIWPVSAIAQARAALASAIDMLAGVVRLGEGTGGGVPSQADKAVFGLDNALARTWRLLSFELFEPEAVKGARAVAIAASDADSVQALLGPVLIVGRDEKAFGEDRRHLTLAAADYRNALASWLSRLAERVKSGKAETALAAPPQPALPGVGPGPLEPDGQRLLAQVEWYGELWRRARNLADLAEAKLSRADGGAIEEGRSEA